ncbi:MAG: DUF1456 family protein [Bacteroidota bacterium]
MNNNDILRRLRYTFQLSDKQMVGIFGLGSLSANQEQVVDWLKKEDVEGARPIYDKDLAAFLEGFIIKNRGAREGVPPNPEKKLNNNVVLRKLKIALSMKDTDMLETFELADFKISKHELSAFFRKPGQSQYRTCKDQILRNFLQGLQLKYRPEASDLII